MSEIFGLAQINVNGASFNDFTHIPAKPSKLRDTAEGIFKKILELNKPIKYQMRLGSNDLEIQVKYQFDYDFIKLSSKI